MKRIANGQNDAPLLILDEHPEILAMMIRMHVEGEYEYQGDLIDQADRLFAGYSNTLTGGMTTRIREYAYGEIATRNHQGTMYTVGSVAGIPHSIAMGYFGAGKCTGWAYSGARYLTGASTAWAAGEGAKNILIDGDATIWDWVAVTVPMLGYVLGKLKPPNGCFIGDTPVVTGRYETAVAGIHSDGDGHLAGLAIGGLLIAGAVFVRGDDRRRRKESARRVVRLWRMPANLVFDPDDDRVWTPAVKPAPVEITMQARLTCGTMNDMMTAANSQHRSQPARDLAAPRLVATEAASAADRPGVPSSATRRKARSRLRNAVSAVLLLTGLLLGWNSLPEQSALATANVPSSILETTPIAEIEIGRRLPGRNADRLQVDRSVPEVDPSTWRRVELRMTKPDGGELSISLLRPAEWLERLGAAPGRTIELELDELGVRGTADVLAVAACPPIEPGAGNVVTGKFVHRSSGNLLDVSLEGSDESIGATANHPFWSEDRQAYVPIGEMVPGELVRTEHGVRRIGKILPRPRDEPVYNLEVHREHVYLVGSAGTLVHNNCPTPGTPRGGGAGPVRQGAAGVNRAADDLEAAGGKVLGTNITVEAGGVRTVPDLYVELPNGTNAFLEIKTGPTARLSTNQATAFPTISTQGGIPWGANAARAADELLMPGMPMPPTPVYTVYYPWPLP